MAITISATELGNYATRYPCLRCAWIRMHVKDLPYQTFPSIFSSIDSFTKNVISAFFEKFSRLPDWLEEIGEVTENIKPPNWRKFYRLLKIQYDKKYGNFWRSETRISNE